MIRYVLKQNKNEDANIFGKWFAYPVIEETLNIDALSEHMSNHNSPFSKGVIKGLLTDMVNCIKEQLLHRYQEQKGRRHVRGRLLDLQEHLQRQAPCPCHR